MNTQTESVATTSSLTRIEEMNSAIAELSTKHCDYDWSKLVELREQALDLVPGIRSRIRALYPAHEYVDQFALYARYYESATFNLIKPNCSLEQMTACRLIQAIATYVMYVKV